MACKAYPPDLPMLLNVASCVIFLTYTLGLHLIDISAGMLYTLNELVCLKQQQVLIDVITIPSSLVNSQAPSG